METILVISLVLMVGTIFVSTSGTVRSYLSKRRLLNSIKKGDHPTLVGISISPEDYCILQFYIQDKDYLNTVKSRVSQYTGSVLLLGINRTHHFRSHKDEKLRKWCVEQSVLNNKDEIYTPALAEEFYLFIKGRITWTEES
jgi:hypothetical protein